MERERRAAAFSAAAIVVVVVGCVAWALWGASAWRNRNPTGVYAAEAGQHRTREEAEAAALARLSRMLRERPRASRYLVNYAYDGKHFGGVVYKALSYNPKARRLFSSFESGSGADFVLAGVGSREITWVAQNGGPLEDLRGRVTVPELAVAPDGESVAVLVVEERQGARKGELFWVSGNTGSRPVRLGRCQSLGAAFQPNGALWYFSDRGLASQEVPRGKPVHVGTPASLSGCTIGRLSWAGSGRLLLAASEERVDRLAEYSPAAATWRSWVLPAGVRVSLHDRLVELRPEAALVAVSRDRKALLRLDTRMGGCQVAAGEPESSRFRWMPAPHGGLDGKQFQVDVLSPVQFVVQEDGRGVWIVQSQHTDMNFHDLRPVDVRRRRIATERFSLMGKPYSLDALPNRETVLCSLARDQAPVRDLGGGRFTAQPLVVVNERVDRRPAVQQPLPYSAARWLPSGRAFVAVTGPAERLRLRCFDERGKSVAAVGLPGLQSGSP